MRSCRTRSTGFATPGNALRLAAAVVLCGLLVPTAVAQPTSQPEQTAAPETEAPSGSVPIPLAKISSRSDETATLLQKIRNRPLPDARADSIVTNVRDALDHYQRLIELTDSQLSGATSVRGLEDIERRWTRAETRTDRWRDYVNRRARSIDRDLETLVDQRETWEATLRGAAEAEAQESIVEIVRTTIANIRAEEKRIGRHRAELLAVQHQLLQLETMIGGAREQIEAAQKVSRNRMYEFNRKPLWEALIERGPRVIYADQLATAWSEAAADLGAFVRFYEDWLWAHAIVFLAFLGLLVSLRRRGAQVGADVEQSDASARVLSRPVSAALVFGLALTYVGYDTAPRAVTAIAALVLFPPLVRILPAPTVSRFRLTLIVLFVFYILVRAMDWIPYEALLRRLVLLVLTVLLFAVLLRFTRRYRTARIELQNREAGTATAVLRVALVLTALAFVANVLGNVALADVIVIAVVLSAYWALILYAFYLVVDTVLEMSLRTRTAARLRIVRWHRDLVHTRFMTVLKYVSVFLWFYATLTLLEIWPTVYAGVRGALTAEARFGDIGLSIADVLAFAVTVWASFLISRILRFVLEEDVFPRLPLPRGVPHALSTGLNYAVLLVGFLLAVAATGADLGKFSLLAGALGVGIGFGLQNIVNNFISGLILIAERPVMPGDTVEVGGMVGDVKRIGARSSTIRTWQGAEVIVPNANLISNEVTNWTLSDRQRRIDIAVGVAYGSPVERVMQLLRDVGGSHPDILDKPEPNPLFMGFGDSSLDFELRVWTKKFESHFRIRSDITVAIEKALNEAGIVIPFPQRDLHLKTVDPQAAARLGDRARDEGD